MNELIPANFGEMLAEWIPLVLGLLCIIGLFLLLVTSLAARPQFLPRPDARRRDSATENETGE